MFYLNNELRHGLPGSGRVGMPFANSPASSDSAGSCRGSAPWGLGGRGSRMKATNLQHHYSILITDDDRGCREALRDIVEPQGFRTLLASCGEEALDIAQGEEVHLALLDMHLPTLTGLEVLTLLRQMRELPVILVTA